VCEWGSEPAKLRHLLRTGRKPVPKTILFKLYSAQGKTSSKRGLRRCRVCLRSPASPDASTRRGSCSDAASWIRITVSQFLSTPRIQFADIVLDKEQSRYNWRCLSGPESLIHDGYWNNTELPGSVRDFASFGPSTCDCDYTYCSCQAKTYKSGIDLRTKMGIIICQHRCSPSRHGSARCIKPLQRARFHNV
jgi:hypothetical protein